MMVVRGRYFGHPNRCVRTSFLRTSSSYTAPRKTSSSAKCGEGGKKGEATTASSTTGNTCMSDKQHAATLRLYRILLRNCQRVEEGNRTATDTVGSCLFVQREFGAQDYGSTRLSAPRLLVPSGPSPRPGSDDDVHEKAMRMKGFEKDWKAVLHAFLNYREGNLPPMIFPTAPLYAEETDDNDDEEYDDNYSDDVLGEHEDDQNFEFGVDDFSTVTNFDIYQDDIDDEEEESHFNSAILNSSKSDDDTTADRSSTNTIEPFFVTSDVLKRCIIETFHLPLGHPTMTKFLGALDGRAIQSLPSQDNITDLMIALRHTMAIEAFQFFGRLLEMRSNTSIFYHPKHHLRVVATSKLLPRRSRDKFMFAYRIRIENCSDPGDVERNHFLILGRNWEIVEQDYEGRDVDTLPIDLPESGVVGQLPVIAPGHAFEYTSSCNLDRPFGRMKGFFYMTIVDEDARSTIVGEDPYHKDPTDKIKKRIRPSDKFQLPVASFPLQP